MKEEREREIEGARRREKDRREKDRREQGILLFIHFVRKRKAFLMNKQKNALRTELRLPK